jgi:hypothetical protein
MKTKLIFIIGLFFGWQSIAQTVYRYTSREYYTYSEAKSRMILDYSDKIASTLTIDDQKKRIQFKISGVKEVAIFNNLTVKGPISANRGKTFLLYIHKDQNNEEVHFYISKEAARIESFGSMVQLFE